MERESTPDYIIEKSSPDDLEAERVMQARSWRATYANTEHGVTQEWVDSYTAGWFTDEKIAQSRHHLQDVYDGKDQLRLTAKQDGGVVGFIHLERHDDNIELTGLYTDPATFGTGLGAQLMEAAKDWMRTEEIFLEVVSYNTRAIRFYQKYGFEIAPGSQHLYQDKMPVIKMIRKGSSK